GAGPAGRQSASCGPRPGPGVHDIVGGKRSREDRESLSEKTPDPPDSFSRTTRPHFPQREDFCLAMLAERPRCIFGRYQHDPDFCAATVCRGGPGMSVSLDQLSEWMEGKEGAHLEFKEARNRYDFDELVKYCTALANEGGGTFLLGVSDKRPRRVVGCQAFDQPERTRNGLRDRLPLRIEFDEVAHPDGRVLVFHVPARPIGTPIQDRGIYWMRDGDRLIPMSADRLRQIFAESGHDFSADICPAASFADLDLAAIEDFRRRWLARSGNQALKKLPPRQLLRDVEAMIGDQLTYAALVLFGTRPALGRHLGQAEVVFEYRSSDASGPAQDRREFRQGFFSFYDELWNLINLRNDKQHYQDGLFVLEIPTFSERPVREAILNAVSH